MARHVIAATVRGFRFALRADWSDPDCEIEIDASESVDAPPGYEWQETGETVGDWGEEVMPLPLRVFYAADALSPPLPPFAVSSAVAALVGHVRAHFDAWAELDEDDARAITAATVTTEEAYA